MIIRRRHTANFTTIGNTLFDDERLAADELGILAWLLSRPHDWEVRRPALMRRHHVGRDALKRIITNWMRLGWCQAQKTRLSNGTFHIIYEIRDEPGCELSEDEIRRALSLVSSEAADGESEADAAAGHPPETGDPPTPKPGVDGQGVVGRHWPIEDSLKTDSVKTESPNCARVFADVKAKWPLDHILSSVAAEAAFASLKESEKEPCHRGIVPYLSDCRVNNRKICDLTTYIRERRWERFTAEGAQATGRFYEIKPGTPQWYRWREYYEVADRRTAVLMDSWAQQGRSRTEKQEWPPAIPKAQAKEPSDQDLNEFQS